MRILIVSGGSGGHLFPALSLGHELKRRGHSDVIFAVDDNLRAKELVRGDGFEFVALDVPKMPYGFSVRWPFFTARLFVSYLKTKTTIKKLDPDIAIGFGAYMSWPAVSIAQSMRKKTLIHEQNAALGRANRVLLERADRVCFSFHNRLLSVNKKYLLTGNPIRQKILDDVKDITKEEALLQLNLSPEKKTLLVMGGSSGAHAINSLFVQLSGHLTEDDKEIIQLIHITGSADLDFVSESYKKNNLKHWVRDFYDRMGFLYKAADLAISRCGATTIAELSLFNKPVIFIPYPGAGMHQRENAKAVVEAGGAILLEQKGLTTESLKQEIFNLIKDKERARRMGFIIGSFAMPDATTRLVDAIEELIRC